jgi:hypothetical protein
VTTDPTDPKHRLLVMYLTGSTRLDGLWREVPAGWDGTIVHGVGSERIAMVPTGNLEWRDDGACAEVWVSAPKLALWRAEHDIDP